MRERHRKAEQEDQRRKAEEEARDRAKKEQLERLEKERWEAEDERRKTEEARKRDKEKPQQKTEEVGGKEQRPPLKRGGRPRGSIKRSQKEQEPGTKPRSLKPETICWNEGWNWVIGIEVPEELETLCVAQNGELLEQDNTDEPRYRLKHAEGTVKITWTGGEKDIPLVGAGRNYLIFKMRKDWKGLGRLVRRPTTGYYLAIVPQEWKRDEEVSDSARINPENVQLDGYKAHFFYQEQNGNTVIGFIAANGERIRVESGSPRFQLAGREIGDASEDMGPLFGGQPPLVRALDERGWSDVGVIVVGEEGSGRNRWRTQFIPRDTQEQVMPDEVRNRGGGWYFLRIYDNDDTLLESMDFRFMVALKDIQTQSYASLPGPDGHDSVTVQFSYQTDCRVELMDENAEHVLEIRRENERTIVSVPPRQDYDKTHWILRDGDAEIEVGLLAERIWWALGVMGVAPADWTDKAIALSRNDFTATSDKALWVKLPRPRWTRQIEVGFYHAKRRSYQVEVEKEKITIPLRDFCDTKEIENRQEESRIMIWVQPEGANLAEAVIARIPADQPGSIQKHWNGCGRKKTAVAYAVLRQGSGEFVVNDEPIWMYFRGAPGKAKRFLWRLLELEEVKPLIEKMAVDVKVGSQPSANRQIKAVTHAVARALWRYDSRLKRLLREKGFGGRS